MIADEYIRKADALDASKITYIECLYEDAEGYIEGKADEIPVVFKRDIEAIPAADVRPVVHGRWNEKTYLGKPWYVECSHCKEDYGKDDLLKISKQRSVYPKCCPNCGAFMDDETAIS